MDAPPSFAFAKEFTTQLLTLATAVIGVTATFTKDITLSASRGRRTWLYVSWIVFLLSILFGLITLGALTGTLAKIDPITPGSVYAPNIINPSRIQALLFFVGILFLIVDAIRGSGPRVNPPTQSTPP